MSDADKKEKDASRTQWLSQYSDPFSQLGILQYYGQW